VAKTTPSSPAANSSSVASLEGGDHAGVVGGDPGFQAVHPSRVVQRSQVSLGEMGGMGLGNLADYFAVLLRG